MTLSAPDFAAVAKRGSFVYCYLDCQTKAPYYVGISSRAARPLEEHGACDPPVDKALIRVMRIWSFMGRSSALGVLLHCTLWQGCNWHWLLVEQNRRRRRLCGLCTYGKSQIVDECKPKRTACIGIKVCRCRPNKKSSFQMQSARDWAAACRSEVKNLCFFERQKHLE